MTCRSFATPGRSSSMSSGAVQHDPPRPPRRGSRGPSRGRRPRHSRTATQPRLSAVAQQCQLRKWDENSPHRSGPAARAQRLIVRRAQVSERLPVALGKSIELRLVVVAKTQEPHGSPLCDAREDRPADKVAPTQARPSSCSACRTAGRASTRWAKAASGSGTSSPCIPAQRSIT